MKHNVTFYETFTIKDENLCVFKPLPSEETELGFGTKGFNSSNIGFAWYDKFLIPIKCIEMSDKIDTVSDAISLIDVMLNMHFEATEGTNKANILIGKYLFLLFDFDDMFPIIYHEIAHIISPYYFDEHMADQFSALHVGSKAFINSFEKFYDIRNEYRITSLRILFDSCKTIKQLQQAGFDGIVTGDTIVTARGQRIMDYKKRDNLPKLRLYLDKNNDIVKEKMKIMEGGKCTWITC